MNADFPLHFINNVANEFQKRNECESKRFIIPLVLFEIAKPFIFIKIHTLKSMKLIQFLKESLSELQ